MGIKLKWHLRNIIVWYLYSTIFVLLTLAGKYFWWASKAEGKSLRFTLSHYPDPITLYSQHPTWTVGVLSSMAIFVLAIYIKSRVIE